MNPDAFECAIPCKVPAAQRSIAIYRGGKSVIARVNDLGPHNKTDDYWNDDGRPACDIRVITRTRAENAIVLGANIALLDATLRAVRRISGITALSGTCDQRDHRAQNSFTRRSSTPKGARASTRSRRPSRHR